MAQMNCNCKFKEQMISRIQEMRREHPGKEMQWADMLFPKAGGSGANELCCLLTALFYYGYCEECSMSLSEKARSVLALLMAGEGMDQQSVVLQKPNSGRPQE